MEQVAKSGPLQFVEASARKQPLVFLDTDVIFSYLKGDALASQLFSAEAAGRIHFAVNDIVLQELLLADAASLPGFERIIDHLHILPLDLAKAEAMLPRVKSLGNRSAHPNEILILSSVDECDFLVTTDARLKSLAISKKPQVVTPEELALQLQAA